MYNPEGSDSPNEFVELYNASTTDTVGLLNWTISDKYSTDDLTDSGYGLQLPPLGYAVILENDYDVLTGIYSNIIPPSAIAMIVSKTTRAVGVCIFLPPS